LFEETAVEPISDKRTYWKFPKPNLKVYSGECVLPVDMERLSMQIQHNLGSETLDAEVIVREYYPYLYRLTYSIVRDPAEADDLAQETLFTAFKKLGQFQPGSNFRAWLSTIAVNKSRDRLRRRRSRRRLQQTLQALASFIRTTPSPEEVLVNKERNEALWTAVDALGEKHRLPLILRYVHNLPVREIAEILQVKEGTIYSRLHYANEKLARQLQLQEVIQDE
jgi:RNA polymerase sigma-70 factor (ECF subfamily)